jgi:hypothetical protein
MEIIFLGLNHQQIANTTSTHLEPVYVKPDIPGLRVDSHLYNNSKLSYTLYLLLTVFRHKGFTS